MRFEKRGSLIRVSSPLGKRKKERKKKILVPTDVFEFFSRRRSREERELPVRFFFISQPGGFSALLGHEFNSNTCRLLRRTARLQAIFQTKKIAAQKERAHTLFEFFFVCKGWSTRRVDYYYARIHSHTRKGRRDARVLLLHFLRARALVAVNLNPSKFFFFFQTITF